MPPGGDLTVGIVLAVLSFIGFETAAALGEETRNPHRNIPRAVFGSMIVVGVFYVLMAYAATVGYGPDQMVTGYANDAAPFDTIARTFGGETSSPRWWTSSVSLSFFSAALAIVNGGARIIFTLAAMGCCRAGSPGRIPRADAGRGRSRCSVARSDGGIALGLAIRRSLRSASSACSTRSSVLLIYFLVNIACIRFFLR